MADTEDLGQRAAIYQIDGAEPAGDVIFMSVDGRGTPGALNSWVLSQFDLKPDELPDSNDLKNGYAINRRTDQTFCFVVTVGARRTADLLGKNLSRALRDPSVQEARSLWIPLMGTGAGKLELSESRAITLQCIEEAGWLERPGVEIIVSGPPSAAPDVPTVQPYDLPRTQAADELLRIAGRLRRVRRTGGSSLSTTLLFFALAESGSAELTPALAEDSAAKGFRVALQRLAGERYAQVLNQTFEVEELPNIALSQRLPPPTDNVATILTEANKLAKDSKIGVHELITVLLGLTQAHYHRILQALAVTAADLFAAYLDERSQFIESVLLSDVAGSTDRLGYARYSTAIADFLTHEKTPPPLSISIQAPWRVGKSSLMQQIRRELDPRGAELAGVPRSRRASEPLRLKDVLRFLERRNAKTKPADGQSAEDPESKLWTVWFNAWKYDTSEQVWAGLVSAIVDQISDRLPLAERELFLLRLQLARIDDGIVRRKIYDRMINLSFSWFRRWIAYAAGIVATYLGLATASKELIDPKLSDAINTQAPYLLPPILVALAVLGYAREHWKARNEPASFSLAEFLQVPPYSEAVGSIHRIHEDLLRVLALTPRLPAARAPAAPEDEDGDLRGRTPIVIFIDDLDRCTPSKIARVVEGVSMFLASDLYRCLFVIGMDPQLIAAALESEHGAVIEKLPSYERAVPLGWRFMDKFIQLPFTIPPSSSAALDQFVRGFEISREKDTETPPAAAAGGDRAVAAGNSLAKRLAVVGRWPRSVLAVLQRFFRSLGGGREGQTDAVAEPPAPADGGATPNVLTPAISLATAARRDVESREVGDLIAEIRASAAGNPRELKRMANLGRLYLQLRNARRDGDRNWNSPTLKQYSRWIALASRWPDAMRWLLWGTDEATWPPSMPDLSLTVRRLRVLEDAASLATTAQEWQGTVHAALRVPVMDPSDWANDVKLFDFFKVEAALAPNQRISSAARMEFW